MGTTGQLAAALAFLALSLAAPAAACGGSITRNDGGVGALGDDGPATCPYGGCPVSSGSGGSFLDQVAVPASCPSGSETTISGKVYDPAGKLPLFNVAVEVAAAAPIDLTVTQQGASCAACTSLYTKAQAYAYTDETGSFTIHQAGSGMQTLIVQLQKWRSVYRVNVSACQDNPQPDRSLRLPSKANASTGANLPHIAVSTGAGDSLECLFHRVGIDDSEFVGGAGTRGGGHIHIFTSTNTLGPGASTVGGSPAPEQQLWDTQAHMMPYDVTLFSCEGAETNALTDAGRKNVYDYVTSGGRAFMSHYHYSWFTPTGPFATMDPPIATWEADPLENDPIGGVFQTTTATGAPFPEGVAMGKWLTNVRATQGGELFPIHNSRAQAVVTSANRNTQLWIAADGSSMNPGNAQYLSFDPPNGDSVCGRVVYSDLHVSGGPSNTVGNYNDYAGVSGGTVPTGCATHDLTAQEKALAFMIFNLSSCLADAGMPKIPM